MEQILRQITGVESGPIFGVWDIGLIAAVSAMATILAYIHNPRWKAFMITLPIPFTLATLSVGRPVDATNAMGLLVLLLYTHGVRLFHYGMKLNIFVSILISVIGYCLLGTSLAKILPPGDIAFWVSSVFILILAAVHLHWYPDRDEPGHRTPMPLWQKLPLTVLVVVMLIILKKSLHGFMTVFPMVGVFASYEGRKSLHTLVRQIPVLILTLLPLMMVIRIAQGRFGIGIALVSGWIVYMLILWPVNRYAWQKKPDGEKGGVGEGEKRPKGQI